MARLALNYGGPEALMRIPIGELKLLDQHLPCVEAERLLGLFSVVQAAVGRMTRDATQSFLRDLKQRANAGKRQKPIKATAEDLAALKIPVHAKGGK